jgi:hypothetical protein
MIGDPFHIIEIDERHRRNREERAALNDPTGTIRARIAMAAAKEEETKKLIAAGTAKIKSYLEYGYSRQDISQMLGIHPYIVDIEASRIEREEGEKDPIFAGWKCKSGGYVCIANGLPTPR